MHRNDSRARLAILAACAVGSYTRAFAADYYWLLPQGGIWSGIGGWSQTSALPSFIDDVYIGFDSGVTHFDDPASTLLTIDTDARARSVFNRSHILVADKKSLTLAGNLTSEMGGAVELIGASKLTFTNAASLTGRVQMQGTTGIGPTVSAGSQRVTFESGALFECMQYGTLTGSWRNIGSLRNYGILNLSSSSAINTGDARLYTGATIYSTLGEYQNTGTTTLDPYATFSTSGQLSNSGTINIGQGASLTCSNFSSQTGSTITALENSTLQLGTTNEKFKNNGQILAKGKLKLSFSQQRLNEFTGLELGPDTQITYFGVIDNRENVLDFDAISTLKRAVATGILGGTVRNIRSSEVNGAYLNDVVMDSDATCRSLWIVDSLAVTPGHSLTLGSDAGSGTLSIESTSALLEGDFKALKGLSITGGTAVVGRYSRFNGTSYGFSGLKNSGEISWNGFAGVGDFDNTSTGIISQTGGTIAFRGYLRNEGLCKLSNGSKASLQGTPLLGALGSWEIRDTSLLELSTGVNDNTGNILDPSKYGAGKNISNRGTIKGGVIVGLNQFQNLGTFDSVSLLDGSNITSRVKFANSLTVLGSKSLGINSGAMFVNLGATDINITNSGTGSVGIVGNYTVQPGNTINTSGQFSISGNLDFQGSLVADGGSVDFTDGVLSTTGGSMIGRNGAALTLSNPAVIFGTTTFEVQGSGTTISVSSAIKSENLSKFKFVEGAKGIFGSIDNSGRNLDITASAGTGQLTVKGVLSGGSVRNLDALGEDSSITLHKIDVRDSFIWSRSGLLTLLDGASIADGNGAIRIGNNTLVSLQTTTQDSRAMGTISVEAGRLGRVMGMGATITGRHYAFDVAGTMYLTQMLNVNDVVVQPGGMLSVDSTYIQYGGNLSNSGLLRSTATFNLKNAFMIGDGSFEPAVENHGVISPGKAIGQMTMLNRYISGADGVLKIEVGLESGALAADKLIVQGNVSLAGTLEVACLSGVVPVGTQFKIMEHGGGIKGTFAKLVSTQQWQIIYGERDVTIRAVPEPSTICGLTGFLLACLRKRRPS